MTVSEIHHKNVLPNNAQKCTKILTVTTFKTRCPVFVAASGLKAAVDTVGTVDRGGSGSHHQSPLLDHHGRQGRHRLRPRLWAALRHR